MEQELHNNQSIEIWTWYCCEEAYLVPCLVLWGRRLRFVQVEEMEDGMELGKVVLVHGGRKGNAKRTTPGIPTWSPTVVLTWPDIA